MLVFILMSLLSYEGSCLKIPVAHPTYRRELVTCVRDIVSEYFAPQKVLTYVGNKLDDVDFLEAIHESNVVAMMSRRSSRKLPVAHQGYFISERNYSAFLNNFPHLTTESTWNPEARFLIVVRDLRSFQLEYIFNRLLKQHVNNVIVVNATRDAHLYTYNPFDNYGCGKRYDEIISYGKCLQSKTRNLYPDKYVTELRNCTLSIAMPHWPPYTLLPSNDTDTSSPLSFGIEPYLLRLIGDIQGFTMNILADKEYNATYSTVSSDMVAAGPLKMLQNNEADAILGGLLLVPSRAVAFDYIFDFLPYVDEIKFLVRRASYVPPWKNVYLEFDATVWALIALSLVFYSMVMIILLRAEDKSSVVLKLLDSLLLHSCDIHCQSTVKCIFIIWVWFAYLINTFYQSSLFSLTTNPAFESQISTEEDILRHNLKPCFSELMDKYYMESTRSQHTYDPIPGCRGSIESVKTVMKSNEHYTLFLYGLYKFNKQDFLDESGNSHIYALKKSYSKVLYAMFFYKGFPLMHELRTSALQLREIGMVKKGLRDMRNLKLIKHHFKAKQGRKSRFAIPWRIYIFGCSVAAITLVVEILFEHK